MLDELSRRVRTILRPRRRALALLRIRAVWRSYRRERQLLAREHHELTICAIFREEAPNLDEWIRFHEGVGVSKFYFYNNFSTDNFRDVLTPYVARGLVDLVDWPVSLGGQGECAQRFGTRSGAGLPSVCEVVIGFVSVDFDCRLCDARQGWVM